MTEEEKREFIQMTLAAMDQKFVEFNMMNQDRMPQNRTQENMNLRVDVAEFSGQSLTPEDYLKWEARLESFFEFKEATEGQQYKLAKSKLTKLAALWLERVQGQRRRENKGKINTWAKLKKHLRRKYVPLSYRPLPNLTPLPPRKTMATPTKQVLTKRDCDEDQTQLQAKVVKTIEKAPVDLELTKPLIVDDKETCYVLNHSEYHKEIQNRKECVHVFTKEISESQVQQQPTTLNSVEDEALDTELIKTIHVDDVELNKQHLQASSTCCEMSGFYFMEDTIIDIHPVCRYYTNDEQRTVKVLQPQNGLKKQTIVEEEQCNIQAKGDIKSKELQEGTLAWMHVDLLDSHGISKAFNVDDSKKHEGNAELRTILFKEGGIDAIMDSPQSKAKEEKHNCIIALAQPIEPMKLADFCLENEEDDLQNRLSINMELRQRQEGKQGSLLIAIKQNRNMNLFPSLQTAESTKHHIACQPTFGALERLALCLHKHGDPSNGISRHGRLHQDLEASQRILTEATRPAPRSLARLTFDNG